MRAYDKSYLHAAMEVLGEACDVAEGCGIGAQRFIDLFAHSGEARAFGGGDPRRVAGLSGRELMLETCARAGLTVDEAAVVAYAPGRGRSCAYWCGWIIAYAQWRSGIPLDELLGEVTFDQVAALYEPWHEASEDRAADRVLGLVRRRQAPTNLAVVRRARGMTQQRLAEASGVSLRAVQQYEQRVKDINRAQAMNVRALAQALGCTMEDLLEF